MFQEEILDDVRLVAEAKHKVFVAILAIIIHEVPQYRPVADRNHRLRNALGVISNPSAKTAAKQDHFHEQYSRP